MARTFGPAEYIGAGDASIRTPETVAPETGQALVIVAPGQLGYSGFPSLSSGTIIAALGYTPDQITSATSPLIRTGNVYSIPQSSGSQSGFLSSTDWSTFNSKQAAIGYTPANDANVVKLTGAQTKAGSLTLSDTLNAAAITASSLNFPGYVISGPIGEFRVTTAYASNAYFTSNQSGQNSALYVQTAEGKFGGLNHYDVAHVNGRRLDVFSQPGVPITVRAGEALSATFNTDGTVAFAGAITASGNISNSRASTAEEYRIFHTDPTYNRKVGIFMGEFEGGLRADSQINLLAGGAILLRPNSQANGTAVQAVTGGTEYYNYQGSTVFRNGGGTAPTLISRQVNTETGNLFEAQLDNGTAVMSVSSAGAITASGYVRASDYVQSPRVDVKDGSGYGLSTAISSQSLYCGLSKNFFVGPNDYGDADSGHVTFAREIRQGFNSITPSYRSVLTAAGARKSEVGDGAGVWQTGDREEYNVAGYRRGFYGATPVAKPSGDVGAALVSLGLMSSATSQIQIKIPDTTTGAKKLYLEVPFAMTITGWKLVADVSGSLVVDIWKDTYANFPPILADTITAAAKPTLSASQKSTSSTLTGWTTALAAGDILEINVDSVTTITNATLILYCTR